MNTDPSPQGPYRTTDEPPLGPEHEAGQIVLDRARAIEQDIADEQALAASAWRRQQERLHAEATARGLTRLDRIRELAYQREHGEN